MRTKEEIEADIARWDGLNKYITKQAKAELRELGVPKAIETKKKGYSEKELYALNKDEQIAILKKLGSKLIPRFEKGRVKLILELQ